VTIAPSHSLAGDFTTHQTGVGWESDIVKFNSTVVSLENQKQRITAMNFIALKSQEEPRFVISTEGRNLS
jgi:hypothetical protein